MAFALLAAIFIVEFAPPRLNRVLEPVVRLLAGGSLRGLRLIGILVIVPWVGEHLLSQGRQESVANVVQLDGASLGVGILILTVMIVPIMVAIVVDALRAVPHGWREGAAALGANRWRVMWTISVRTARPAIVAAAVLATARALGEAIMLSMVAGSASFAPNPIDGITFLFEPTRPLASALVENVEGLSVVPFGQTLFAFAAVLLVSSMLLSLAGFAAKQPMRKYGGAALMEAATATRVAPTLAARQRRLLAAARPHWLLRGVGGGADPDRRRRRDRPLHGLQGPAVLRPRPAARKPGRLARPVDQRRLPGPADRHRAAAGDVDRDRGPAGGDDRGLAYRVRPPSRPRPHGRIGDRGSSPARPASCWRCSASSSSSSSGSASSPSTPKAAPCSAAPSSRPASMMSLIALPLVVGATREALNAIPGHVREASYALGKTKAATIRRVLLPAARPGIGTGTALGMGRVAGDTAIVVVLLGATLQILNGADGSVFGLFRGTGSTLTSYVYYNSPAGEGLAPEKAYFAAFCLLGDRDRAHSSSSPASRGEGSRRGRARPRRQPAGACQHRHRPRADPWWRPPAAKRQTARRSRHGADRPRLAGAARPEPCP
jgi:ABC-type phosphate transport system permease subunit